MLERFNLVVGNVQKRLDRVEGRDKNNDRWRNKADWRGNHDKRLKRHVNHNLVDFEDEDDFVGDDDLNINP